MSDAAKLALMEKPQGWTQAQHLEASQKHADARTELKEKIERSNKAWHRKRFDSDAAYEAALAKQKAKIAKLEDEYEYHHEMARRHLQWSRFAYRERSDYEIMMSEPRKPWQ